MIYIHFLEHFLYFQGNLTTVNYTELYVIFYVVGQIHVNSKYKLSKITVEVP